MKSLKNAAFAATILVASTFSITANSAVIEYGEFTQEENSNYSTGLGLDWIKWDVTKGMSIRSALTAFADEGWRIASGEEIVGLFSYFVPTNEWENTESVSQTAATGFSELANDPNELDVQFIELFGTTYTANAGDYMEGDLLYKSEAFFGDDANGNNRYGLATIYDDFTVFNGNQNSGNSLLNKDTFSQNFAYNRYGVALVRGELDLSYLDADLPGDPDNGGSTGNGGGSTVDVGNGSTDDDVVTVPEPGTLGMFALAGLLFMRKRSAK